MVTYRNPQRGEKWTMITTWHFFVWNLFNKFFSTESNNYFRMTLVFKRLNFGLETVNVAETGF